MEGTLKDWQRVFDSPVVGSILKTDSNNSDISVADTVGMMVAHVNGAIRSSQIKNAVDRAGITNNDSDSQVCGKVFNWVKNNVEFVEDETQLARIFGQPTNKELLITPQVLLGMRSPKGDCDDFSMLCSSMLGACGIRSNFVTIAADRGEPRKFSHIYNSAITSGGMIPMDCSHGKRLGWEYPNSSRTQVWPIMIWKGENNMFGLGDDSGWIYDAGSDSYVPPPITTGTIYGASSTGTDNAWIEGLISSLANVGGKIAIQSTQKPGYQSTGPNGQSVSYVAGPGQSTSTLNIPGFSTTGSITPLVIGGVALLGLLFFMRK